MEININLNNYIIDDWKESYLCHSQKCFYKEIYDEPKYKIFYARICLVRSGELKYKDRTTFVNFKGIWLNYDLYRIYCQMYPEIPIFKWDEEDKAKMHVDSFISKLKLLVVFN